MLTPAGALAAAWRRAASAPYVMYFCAVVAVAFLADPSSFAHSWNQGRAATIAVVPLVLLEMGSRSLAPLGDGREAAKGWLTVAFAGAYYVWFAQAATFASVVALGRDLGVSPAIVQYSWVWGIDYAVTSGFLLALLSLQRGSRTVTPLIYTAGMASFLFIDVLLPENTLGPFGYVVPPVLKVVASTLDLFSPGAAASNGNVLSLQSALGAMRLEVFWPSAGLDGMVIGLLVVLAICVKAGTGWMRGAAYMLVGVIGSFLVNALRLVLLAAYAVGNIGSPQAIQAFHSVIGELVFVPWIAGFVLVVLRRETKPAPRSGPRPGTP